MIHIYEIDSGRGIYWDVFQDIPGEPWQDDYLCTLEGNEYDEYLNNLRDEGADFIIHGIDEYDEYHILLSS